mgnify:FL=1
MNIKNLDTILKGFDEKLESENFGLYIDAYTPNRDETDIKNNTELYQNLNELDFNSWN